MEIYPILRVIFHLLSLQPNKVLDYPARLSV